MYSPRRQGDEPLPNRRDFYERELNMPLSPREWPEAGRCPFHDDRSAGSFYVNLGSGGFKCFACGAGGGSIVEFIKQRDGLDYVEALNWIRSRYGITV